MIDSHKQDDIIKVLQQQPIELREQVEEVSVDMWGGFPKVVQEVFPKARIVFDRFHQKTSEKPLALDMGRKVAAVSTAFNIPLSN